MYYVGIDVRKRHITKKECFLDIFQLSLIITAFREKISILNCESREFSVVSI